MKKQTETTKFDYSKLLGKLKEKNITQDKLAEIAGISPSTLNLKLNNKSDFKTKEMLTILKCLGLPTEDIGKYFFCEKTFENAS